jgi:hypothetical protein
MKTIIPVVHTAVRGADRRRRRWILPALLLLASTGLAGPAGSAAPPDSGISKEYKVKATWIFNFAQFADWPATAFADASTPIAIGVLGDDAFGPFLDQLVQGETVKSRPLVVKRARTVADLKTCHILFVSKSEQQRLAGILADLRGAGALTVGEVEGFTQRGGMINFFLKGDKLRFEINLNAARDNGIRLSSKLLSLGSIVGSDASKE